MRKKNESFHLEDKKQVDADQISKSTFFFAFIDF